MEIFGELKYIPGGKVRIAPIPFFRQRNGASGWEGVCEPGGYIPASDRILDT